jgi:DNA polymerase lambda
LQALDLILRGFRDIAGVRAAIREGRHFLDRNQLVGVDCYEDILEEMERDEVKMIGDLVDEVVQEIFPNAAVQIMGSYRRQKATCGDIDIHITHESFVKKNPDQGLSRIVDLLWERGQIVYHLTFLPGMETGSKVSDYTKSSRHIPKDAWKLSKSVGYMSSKGSHGSSYMGVVRSPKMEGKRRRIDIKFYPWRERAFASIYFTGNGYFNRSMRLWASRKFR